MALLLSTAAAAEETTDAPRDAKPASAPAVEKVADIPKEGSWRLDLQAGGGYDSNVLRSAAADVGAATWTVRGGVLGRPLPRLSLQLAGSHVSPLGVASLAESDVTFLGLYRVPLSESFSVGLSSLSAFHRGITVFTEAGTVLPAEEDPSRQQLVLLRSELAEHFEAALQYQAGGFDVAAGGRADLKSVTGAEIYSFLGLGPTVAVRWMPSTNFSGRLRYAYTLRNFDDGLRGRNPYGGPLAVAGRKLQLGVHEVGPNAHLRLAETVTLRGSYALELYSDNFLGFLDGLGHRAQLGAQVEVDALLLEAAAVMRHRTFTMRRVSPIEPGSETSIGGRLEASYFFTANFGVYVRYEADWTQADPTGLLYLQHLVTVGPAGRLGLGGT